MYVFTDGSFFIGEALILKRLYVLGQNINKGMAWKHINWSKRKIFCVGIPLFKTPPFINTISMKSWCRGSNPISTVDSLTSKRKREIVDTIIPHWRVQHSFDVFYGTPNIFCNHFKESSTVFALTFTNIY